MICSKMFDAAATTETPAADSDAWKPAAVQRHVALLEQLAEAGLRLALTLEAEAAKAAAQDRPVRDDAAMAFSRVARAVRLTVLLQAKLMEGPPARRPAPAGAGPADEGPISYEVVFVDQEPPVPVELARSRQVRDIVRRVAEDAGLDRDTVERLAAEAGDRCKGDDIYFLVRGRRLGELVAFICQELGLDPDWSRLAQEDWAQAEIADPPPGSPFRPPPPTEATPPNGASGPNSPSRHGFGEGWAPNGRPCAPL